MTAEERAAINWLEGLSPAERGEYFHPAITPIVGFDEGDRIGFVATLKDDHEGNRAYCAACKDPSAVVVA